MNNLQIDAFNLTQLLGDKESYEIPIYQRNYAWQEKEINQLIQDVMDYAQNTPDKNYYIGTLVVAKGKNRQFITIDGQQRLTTLTILTSVLKNEFSQEVKLDWFNHLNLNYASRNKSINAMKAAFIGVFNDEDYDVNIKEAYKICIKAIKEKIIETGISSKQFTDYLYQFVKILRVPLPQDIDLNHYFEIMNSRGEQLEKHEILKAQLMQCFIVYDEKKREQYFNCFHLVWEACSNMEKYVQYGFDVEERHVIFGKDNWNTLSVNNFDDIVEKIGSSITTEIESIEQSIDEIIASKVIPENKKENEENSDRFNTVVNFQNFLLHVLRVQLAIDEVALDDKRLLDIFKAQMPEDENEKVEFAKTFIYNLLRCKFLFDKYIIKREFIANTDRWSLKSLKWFKPSKAKNGVKYTNTFGDENNETSESENRRIIMLLSMFHVSIPSMSYKYWLNASLNYLFNQFEIESKHYISYLEHIAKSFVFDRFLSNNPKGYYEMVYLNLIPIERNPQEIVWEKLRYGQIENNLVFNFLDYLLWLNMKATSKDNRVRDFEFKFRSSVEHYYPQVTLNSDIRQIEEGYLHSFGNLCLISHEKNSKLSNQEPIAKQSFYKKSSSLDSIKQFVMMDEEGEWDEIKIEEHRLKMESYFKDNCNSFFKNKAGSSLASQWFRYYQQNDRELLIRVLLCFGDCAKHISDKRYNLFDFEYIRNHESFIKFEDYVIKNNPKTLLDIINSHLELESLKLDYRYLFVKYPETIKYCKEGNFQWINEGKIIFLLEANKKTTHKAKELYSFLIQQHFLVEHKLDFFCNSEGVYIKIGFKDGFYYVTNINEDAVLEITIRNEEGIGINHFLRVLVNGNSKAVKLLNEYKWVKNSDGDYEKFGKSKIFTLGNNFNENLDSAIEAIKSLLKSGLGIKFK